MCLQRHAQILLPKTMTDYIKSFSQKITSTNKALEPRTSQTHGKLFTATASASYKLKLNLNHPLSDDINLAIFSGIAITVKITNDISF